MSRKMRRAEREALLTRLDPCWRHPGLWVRKDAFSRVFDPSTGIAIRFIKSWKPSYCDILYGVSIPITEDDDPDTTPIQYGPPHGGW